MSDVWGNKIKYALFGESHGEAIGVVIDGLPAGLALDWEAINMEMNRRKPGANPYTTPRQEDDAISIVSGYFNGKTTGDALCAFIKNKDQKSRDYEKTRYLMRPSHADYTVFMKSEGHNDYRGGGHTSARLTAPLVFAGAIAKQVLREKNILVGGHIRQIGKVKENALEMESYDEAKINDLKKKILPVHSETILKEMLSEIDEAKKQGDSIGGCVEGFVLNLPVGIGAPFFDSLESVIAQMVFAIPGVKGIEFGKGFDFASSKGSEANDTFCIEDGQIKTRTNNNGGILGGISNGMPIQFNVVFKPTPSIFKNQDTVDVNSKTEEKILIEGRHDPCIAIRGVPVVEAVTAIAILEFVL